jgi:hypothetical protein
MPERLEIPAANGVDRATYGRMLKVPPIDGWSEHPGNVHLWHLVHDNDTLKGLLEEDIRTFGQLSGLAAAGGERVLAVLGITGEVFEGAKARARLIDATRSTWRIGRARPVSYRDIAEAGILPASSRAIVAPIVEQERGDGANVLDRLRKELPDADDTTLDRLESWLIAQGCVANSEPLSRDEIRPRLLASVSADIERERLSLRDLDDILNQLPA